MSTRTDTTTLIALASERLRATQVGTRWHYYDESMRTTYSATRSEMISLGEMIRDGVDDAYSHWCAAHVPRIAR
jgi:hypothetical protein